MKHSILYLSLSLIILACQPKRSDNKTKKEILRHKIATNKIRIEKAWQYNYRFGQVDTANGFLFQLTVYNTDGNAIYSNNYNRDDSTLNTSEEYFYDIHGNDSATVTKDSEGNITAVIKNQYDEQLLNTARLFYTSEGQLDRKIVYAYDDRGQIKELTCYDAAGKLIYAFQYAYNKHGDEALSKEFDKDGKLVIKSELVSDTDTSLHYNVYNSENQLTHKFFNTINKKRHVTKQGFIDMKDNSVHNTVFVYDRNDFIVERITYDPQGEPAQLTRIVREQQFVCEAVRSIR